MIHALAWLVVYRWKWDTPSSEQHRQEDMERRNNEAQKRKKERRKKKEERRKKKGERKKERKKEKEKQSLARRVVFSVGMSHPPNTDTGKDSDAMGGGGMHV